MASTATLKELARAIIESQDISEITARNTIEKLSRADLKRLLLFIRLEMQQRRVRVTTADPANGSFRDRIHSMFPGSETAFAVDPALGGGMRIEHGDDIIDISVKGLLQRTYQQIKERL